jgi:hypothetical protein
MGIVYKARDTDLHRIVALKMIKAGMLASDTDVIRFQREAEAAALLNHPNIVPIYDIGMHDGCLYFTMAFAAGGSLLGHKQRLHDDPRAAIALLEQVARAVHFAHERGIVHRDLKPANILLDDRGTPWVSDFGLAKFLDASLEVTYTGQIMGTPAYMAPEQASGQTGQLGPHTDVWALGVILYELLTGHRPFQGTTRDEQRRRIQADEPAPPGALRPAVDRELGAVILKCLEKDPARRHASARVLADDLARWLRGEAVLARPPSWPVRYWRAGRRRLPLARKAVFAALLVAVVVLAWRLTLSSAPRAVPQEAQQRRALEEQIARARSPGKVTLIGLSGGPAWSEWQAPPMDGLADLGLDKVFRVTSRAGSFSLLELAPRAPPRFRLHAQVQHLGVDDRADNEPYPPEVGVYFAHGKAPRVGTTVHWFYRFAFSDWAPAPHQIRKRPPVQQGVRPPGQVHLVLSRCQDLRTSLNGKECMSRQFTPAAKGPSTPWRRLTVEVTPERIRTFWEGRPLTAWLRRDPEDNPGAYAASTAGLLGSLCGLHPLSAASVVPARYGVLVDGYDPRFKHGAVDNIAGDRTLGEGIGLFVRQGAAAFRSVEIEPLPE